MNENEYYQMIGKHSRCKNLMTLVESYLELRRSLGFKDMQNIKYLLVRFLSFLHDHKMTSYDGITLQLAEKWLHLRSPQESTVVGRISHMRAFYHYLAGMNVIKENIWKAFPAPEMKRFIPHIYSASELKATLDYLYNCIDVPQRPKQKHFRFARYVLVHSLYACGFRACEVCRLTIGDTDLNQMTFTIRKTKFYKTRIIPFNSRTRELLVEYLKHFRPCDDDMKPDRPLFLNISRQAFVPGNLKEHMEKAFKAIGIYQHRRIAGNVVYGSTNLHAFRHAFAVHRLLKWYRDGVDVNAKLPLLSTYMGHSNYRHTQWYLTVLPCLTSLAGERFAARFEPPLKELE